jgi:hypothetical protein
MEQLYWSHVQRIQRSLPSFCDRAGPFTQKASAKRKMIYLNTILSSK